MITESVLKRNKRLKPLGLKYCSKCEKELPFSEFVGQSRCKVCIYRYQRSWIKSNFEHYTRRRKKYERENKEELANKKATRYRENREGYIAKKREMKQAIMSHYCKGAPKCQCVGCETTFLNFLQMDHINGDGRKHREGVGCDRGGQQILYWLRRNNFPEGFQVLCANCNGVGGKGKNSQCPLYGQKHY